MEVGGKGNSLSTGALRMSYEELTLTFDSVDYYVGHALEGRVLSVQGPHSCLATQNESQGSNIME